MAKQTKKKKNVQINPIGEAHIQASFNNIIISLCNDKGQVISWSSAGKMGFRGSKKNTPYAAQIAAEECSKEAFEFGGFNFAREMLTLLDNLQRAKKSIQETINGFIFEYEIFEDLLVKELKPTAEQLLKNSNANIVCLISKVDDKASVVISVDKTTTKKLSAVDLVKEASAILDGKGGGGRTDMAQSGGASPENALLAIETIKDYIKNKS